MTAVESRAAQGLPPKIEDPAVLREAARIIVAERAARTEQLKAAS